MLCRTYFSQIHEDNNIIVVNCEYSKMNIVLEDYYKKRYEASMENYNLIRVETVSEGSATSITIAPHLTKPKWVTMVYLDKVTNIDKLVKGMTITEHGVYIFFCERYAKYLRVIKELTDVCSKEVTCLQISLNWLNKTLMKEIIHLVVKGIEKDAEQYVLNNLEYDTEIFYDFIFECRKIDHVQLSDVRRFRSVNTNSYMMFRQVVLGRVGTKRRDRKFIKMYKNFITQEGFKRACTILRNMFSDLLFIKKLLQEGYINNVVPIDIDSLKEKYPKKAKYLTTNKIRRYLRLLKGLTYQEVLSMYLTVEKYSSNETDFLMGLYKVAERGIKLEKVT